MPGDISEMDGPINLGQKDIYELIWYRVHYLTFTFDPTYDFDLGFSRSTLEIAVFQEWVVRLTWDERNMNQ